MEFSNGLLSGFWSVFLIIVFFGGSIFVHELGHYLAARWRGLVIERFSIGFGPKLFGFMRDGVEWRVSALPLGGYVALPQLADMRGIEGEGETETEKLPPISYADTMFVAVAGVVFNLIFAFVMAILLWYVGIPTSEQQETTRVGVVHKQVTLQDGSEVAGPAKKAGIRAGDYITSVDGEKVESWSDFFQAIVTSSGRTMKGDPKLEMTVERDGEVRDVVLYPVLGEDEGIRTVGLEPASAVYIYRVSEHGPADLAGLQSGDLIVSYDDKLALSSSGMTEYIKQSEGPVEFVVDRGGETLSFQITPVEKAIYKDGETQKLIGINMGSALRLIIGGVVEGSPAEEAGLREGDVILEYDGIRAVHSVGLDEYINENPEKDIVLTVDRGGETLEIPVTSVEKVYNEQGDTKRDIGILLTNELHLKHPTPLEQFDAAFTMTFKVLGALLNPSSDVGLSKLSGAPGIAYVVHKFSFDIRLVISFVVLININLAILNLLPIPVLDGGHMMFATIGKIRGRKLPPQFIQTAQACFMVLLLGLMVYVMFFDVRRIGRDIKDEQKMEEQMREERENRIEINFEAPEDRPAQPVEPEGAEPALGQ